jgi:hypothetical protein
MPRLATDGAGNLYIDEPGHEDHAKLVKYHEGSFVVIGPDEPSHNDTHEQQVLVVDGTRDADSVNAAAEAAGQDPANFQWMVNAGDGENMHHFETQSDDAHYDENSPNLTKMKTLPDALSATMTSHTDAWNSNE